MKNRNEKNTKKKKERKEREKFSQTNNCLIFLADKITSVGVLSAAKEKRNQKEKEFLLEQKHFHTHEHE